MKLPFDMKAISPALLLCTIWLFSGCQSFPSRPSTSPKTQHSTTGPGYAERLDAWRASNFSLALAKSGDRDAQRAFFLAGYVRVSEPYLGGEDIQQMIANFEQLLTGLGDDGFVSALNEERPEVRSATRWYIDMARIQTTYPKTWRELSLAPSIDWPINKGSR